MLRIRKGKPGDARKIIQFQLAMAKETEGVHLDPVIVKKGVDAVFQGFGNGMYFVAEAENKVIASLMITYEWSDWRNRNVYWIQSVYVTPDHRRKGVFKMMYKHIQKLVEQDVTLAGIRLYVDSGNFPAQKVYERLGMDGTHYRMFEWMKQK